MVVKAVIGVKEKSPEDRGGFDPTVDCKVEFA